MIYRYRGKPSTQEDKIKMYSNQSKIKRHSINKEYISHNKEKTQLLETKSEIT